jgi:hypothetical protein
LNAPVAITLLCDSREPWAHRWRVACLLTSSSNAPSWIQATSHSQASKELSGKVWKGSAKVASNGYWATIEEQLTEIQCIR